AVLQAHVLDHFEPGGNVLEQLRDLLADTLERGVSGLLGIGEVVLDAPARQIRADRWPPALASGVGADLATLLTRYGNLHRVGPQLCLPEVDYLAARSEQAPPQLGQLVAQG